ncbi:uncharacterized protein LOC144452886 [Glandiceps talaboti]
MATAELSSPEADLPGPHPIISPYGERLSKYHTQTEYPKPFTPSKRKPRRKLERYKTQPITFMEIKEVDEDDDPLKSPKSPTAQELKCPQRMKALDAAIARTLDKAKLSPEPTSSTTLSYRRQTSLQRSAEV